VILLEETNREVDVRRRQVRSILGRQQGQTEQFGPGIGQVTLGHQAEAGHQRGKGPLRRLVMQATCPREVGVLKAAMRHQVRTDLSFSRFPGQHIPMLSHRRHAFLTVR